MIEQLCLLEYQLFDSYPTGRKLVERDKPHKYWSKKVFNERYLKKHSKLGYDTCKLAIFSDIMIARANKLKAKNAVVEVDSEGDTNLKKSKKKPKKGQKKQSKSKSPSKGTSKKNLLKN